ncbi:Aspartate dehydrogenase, NAD biosynthesis [Candidatus Omnitrophus magneticus]|uniref:L-aspartate dehydrogenase n=1 Tax=Candidatus Omnitrophus magneticus TaxID=1609969 RepID=A0A0F0CUQ2_9BACT|nr:Aspartate dehydrogenase, NAD biosynthesis [Candidatus Omnitrophus magneticus]
MANKTLGIIGAGNIGSSIATFASKELKDNISKIILYDINEKKSLALARKIKIAHVVNNIEKIFEFSDIIIECATPIIVKSLVEMAVKTNKNIMIMSVGGMLAAMNLLNKARKKGIKIILPSGAIAGIDGIKSAKEAGIEKSIITTIKPPKSLENSPYVLKKGIDVYSLKKDSIIFEGNALQAIKAFPHNINVSCILAIAGCGPRKTKVRVVISPNATRNVHEVEIIGKSGIIKTQTTNVPSPDNPKTSYLASLSAMAALREYFDSIKIGT